MADEDVPSPIDFHNPDTARAWVEDTVRRRPWRPQFFAAFAAELNGRFARPVSVLELGSGPGHLAEHILRHCAVQNYVAIDFSDAMNQIAGALLSPFQEKLRFVRRDFRAENWGEDLGLYDAVVTMQAAHEMRHKRHLVRFLRNAGNCLDEDGLFLYCDHYAQPRSRKDDALFVPREMQTACLRAAGYAGIQLLLDEGGMALYAAAKR